MTSAAPLKPSGSLHGENDLVNVDVAIPPSRVILQVFEFHGPSLAFVSNHVQHILKDVAAERATVDPSRLIGDLK